jgi:hypothetical protein
MVVQEQVAVSQAAREMGKKLVAFISELKKASADGIQLSDLAVVAAASLADLLPAISLASQASLESKEDIGAFVAAIELSAKDLVAVFL